MNEWVFTSREFHVSDCFAEHSKVGDFDDRISGKTPGLYRKTTRPGTATTPLNSGRDSRLVSPVSLYHTLNGCATEST